MSLVLTLACALALQAGAGAPVAPPAPFGPVPSERQLAWHERQFYGFVHFGPNTFTGVEWGEGREDPRTFAPSDLDCRQWVAAMKSAGMTGVILTAKHHDGFCLFASEHTTHDVESSGAPRDVLKELADACRAQGLWLGVYLSPWDRREPLYGTGEPYNEHFRAQLREALTNYGEVAEVWFDGACGEGPNGKRQVYDWPSFVKVVRDLQPGACIFSDGGPDVRWCGNERAIGSETNWALLRRDEVYPGYPQYQELGPGHEDGTHWVPYECNTSIRPGWFWKAGLDDQVKSLETLLDTWYASVGRSGNFLLNCPPDDRGRLPDVDVARLAEVGRVLKETFDEDLLRTAAEGPGVHFLASNVRGDDAERFGPIGLLEPGRESYWALDDDHTTGWVELRFEEPVTFDNVWLEEAIQLGQRITQWRVEAAVDDAWARVAEGTTLGARRVLRAPVTTTKKLRLYIDGAKACPTVSRLSLYLSPPRVELATPGGTSFERAELRAATRPGAVVRWTRDGSEPTASSPELPAGPVVLTDSATVALRAFEGRRGSPYVTRAEFQVLHASDALTPIHFVRAPDPGFTWRRYAGRFQSVAQFEGADPGASAPVLDAEGRAGEVSAAPLDDGPGALVFEGFLYARELGPWRVATTSDDGSRVWLGGRLVVDNDGLHGATRVEGTVVLAAGYYPVRIAYFDAGGGRALAFEAAPYR